MARKRNTTAAWKKAEADILAKLDIAAEYSALGVQVVSDEPNDDGWLSCYALGRDDQNPSAAVNLDTGRYLDSGGDGLSLALWNFAAQFGGHATWQEAREHYAKKAGVKLPSDDPPRDPAANLVWQPWNDRLAALWCRHKPGVTPESIKAAGGRIARYYKQFTVIALPILGAALNGDDPVGWVLWNTTGADLPVYHGKGKKKTFAKMKTTGGGEAGLIGLDGLRRITTLPENAIVWLVEGPTDLLALWSMIPEDRRDRHIIITNAGGSMQRPRDWMAPLFAGRLVAVVRDADAAGEQGSERWAGWLSTIAAETRRVKLPYPTEAKHGKDLRDYFADGHIYANLLELVDQAEPVQAVDGATQKQANSGKHNATTSQNKTSSANCGAVDTETDLGTQAIEAEDDPYRLARVNLERYATRTDGRTIRYWRGEWYVWKRNCYRKIDREELRAKLTQSVKEEFDRLNLEEIAAQANQDTDKPVTARKISMALVSNVIQATSGLVCLSGETELGTWLPAKEKRNFVSMANGLLDLDALFDDQDDCIQPNTPKWFSTTSLGYNFDPDANCLKWEAFLEHNLEMDPERIKLAQEWAGYLLSATTNEQKFMLLEGEGRNGKSVFIAGLTAMLGVENVSNVPLENFGDRFALTNTIGKLLNAVGDCGELDKTAEGQIKSFASGDRMFFDRKGISGINYTPTARLMVACNNLPRFSDRSEGIWRRVLVIPWKIRISDEEVIPGMDKIAWWQASGELPGIFLWALAGLARMKKQRGFTKSEEMRRTLDDYREEMNPAKSYLQQYVEEAPGSAIQSAALYSSYRHWTQENGYRPLSERQFGKEVRRSFRSSDRKYHGSRTERYYVYTGIAWSQENIPGVEENEKTLF